MKFMTLTLSLLFSLNLYAQSREELLEEFLKERRKMLEEIQKMFRNDFDNDSFFSDDMDPFSKLDHFKSSSDNLSIEEKYENDGSVSIIITPKSKYVELDIKTNDNAIIITSKTRMENETKKGDQSFKSFSSSSSSRTISIPQGYKASSPKPFGEKGIKISLTPTDKTRSIMSPEAQMPKAGKKESIKKIPLGKRPGEDTL